jgi:hypothetical protein
MAFFRLQAQVSGPVLLEDSVGQMTPYQWAVSEP